MEEIYFSLNSAKETDAFGRALGTIAAPGDVICLDGDLGAGKTTMTQSIAGGVGVPASCYVTSPSFAIFHEYPGRLPLYHMDFYRLHDCTEIEDLGLDEYFYMDGVCVIEWALRGEEILPDERLHLYISITAEQARMVRCLFNSKGWGDRMTWLLHSLRLDLPEKS